MSITKQVQRWPYLGDSLNVRSSFARLLLASAVSVVAYETHAGVLADNFTTEAPNNDDYTGVFGDVNSRGFANFLGFDGDQLFVVQPSGGTTEYAISLTGAFSNSPADVIWLKLGFGVGDNFVSAADVLPELDFDAPLPGLPPPISDEFATVDHQPHVIEYSDGRADTLLLSFAQFSIDVPDLPTSVNDYYEVGQLPADLPAGAAVFTLRKRSEGEFIGPTLAPSFAEDYSVVDLGSVAGVDTSTGGYGGLTFLPDDPQTLLTAGNAETEDGTLFAVEVVRDAENHITGFAEPATRYADAAFIDGGVQFGPGGVLFLSRWPNNELGQNLPGSTTTDKVVSLDTVGVTDGPGGLSFVPAGMPGEGQLKVVGAGGQWYTLEITPDGSGAFDVTAAHPGATLPENALGIAYVPLGSPVFGMTPTVLISEWTDDGRINAYDVDANGNPIADTKREFLTGLVDGSWGALVDPLTGDLLFTSTPFFDDGKVLVVRGFVAPVPEPSSTVLILSGVAACVLLGARRRQTVPTTKQRITVCIFLFLATSANSHAATFTGLGVLPGGLWSAANAISDDGSAIVGNSGGTTIGFEAFRWTAASGMEGLGDLPGGRVQSEGKGINADHSVVVGHARSGSLDDTLGGVTQEARWTESTGWETLGTNFVISGSRAEGVSADGSVIVGTKTFGSYVEAFRWTESTGLVTLGFLPGIPLWSKALAISPDAKVIVGEAAAYITEAFRNVEAFRWTAATGMVGLGHVPPGEPFHDGYGGSATDVSADGLVIVGSDTTAAGKHAFRWTQETGMVSLRTPDMPFFEAAAVSGDGSVIVGDRYIWDATNGTRSLEEVFVQEFGLAQDLAGWRGLTATDVSADGRVIIGKGHRGPTSSPGYPEAWVAYLDQTTSSPRPPGDYNGDGITDGTDLLVWQRGESPIPLSYSDLETWKTNFGSRRLLGVVGTQVTSAEVSATNELQSFVAGGVTYTQRDLIQPTLIEFAGNPEKTTIATPDDGPLPEPGARAALLTHDFRLDTGITNPAIDPMAATLTFSPPLVNGPGPDLVVFEATGTSQTVIGTTGNEEVVLIPRAPDAFQLQVDQTIGFVLESSWGRPIAAVDYDGYAKDGGVPSSISELENGTFAKSLNLDSIPVVGIAIDLDELGVDPFGQISTLHFGSFGDSVDPVLFMGINSVSLLPVAGDLNGTDGFLEGWVAYPAPLTVPEPSTAATGLLAVTLVFSCFVWRSRRAHLTLTPGRGGRSPKRYGDLKWSITELDRQLC